MTIENNKDELNEQSAMATERQHVIDVIQSVQQRIALLYNAYPVFCIGDMQDAFNSAFTSNSTEEHRPLLICIHHDNTLDLFCSPILIEFLQENYIIWPWNISNPADRRRLTKMWQDNFPEESCIDCSIDQCPMLIGVMRSFTITSDSFPEYKPEVLLADDILVRTNQEVGLETLLYQLIVFKEEFDKNERYLSSDFVRKIAKCPELVVEISEYLSLNDAVATFSPSVLSLLSSCKINLPVIEPSEEFVQTIIQRKNQDEIRRLCLKADRFTQTMKSVSTNTLMNLESLAVSKIQRLSQIPSIEIFFSNLSRLSLRYDGEVDFHRLCKIFDRISTSIKHFTVHCDSIRCPHYSPKYFFVRINGYNKTLESFVLHVNHTSLSRVNNCLRSEQKCVLNAITSLIEIMSHIRFIHIATKGNIEALLDVAEWTTLMDKCRQVKKIQLEGMKNISQDKRSNENIQEIEHEMHKIRESIRFNVQVK